MLWRFGAPDIFGGIVRLGARVRPCLPLLCTRFRRPLWRREELTFNVYLHLFFKYLQSTKPIDITPKHTTSLTSQEQEKVTVTKTVLLYVCKIWNAGDVCHRRCPIVTALLCGHSTTEHVLAEVKDIKLSFQTMSVTHIIRFLDPVGGSQKATLVVVLLVVISSLKFPKAFLIGSRAQRNFAYTFELTFPTDLPFQIFHLFSN